MNTNRINKYVRVTIHLLPLILLTGCMLAPSRVEWPEALTTHKVNLTEASPLELLWVQNVFPVHFVSNRRFAASNGKVLFIGSLDQNDPGGLMVLDGESGNLLWSIPEAMTIAVDSDVVFVGDQSYVTAYNLLSGEKIWKTKLPGARNIGSLNNCRGKLYINSSGSYFYYLVDSASGDVIARSEQTDIFGLSRHITSALSNYPAMSNTMIYFRADASDAFSAVVAMDVERNVDVWKTENNVISNVAATASKAFVVTYDDELQILDAGSGRIIYTAPIEPSINFFDRDLYSHARGYQVAVDETNNTFYLLLGDSNQLFAFTMKSGW